MAQQSTFLARCTTRLVGLSADRQELSFGTGFFYKTALRGDATRTVLMVVTNKHVVRGCAAIRFTATTIASDANMDAPQPAAALVQNPVELPTNSPLLVMHPDPNVDLCAFVCTPLLAPLIGGGRQLYASFVSQEVFLSPGEAALMRHIERVTMVGYPNGLWDHVNDAPLIRQGCTATHPLQSFQGRREFVIDMTCLPGSSGSPVFLFEDGLYRSSAEAMSIGSRMAFLGVLWGGPTMSVEGKIEVRPIPTAHEPVPMHRAMMGLGYVIHASQLLSLEAAVHAAFEPLLAPPTPPVVASA